MDILDNFISKAKESISEGYYDNIKKCELPRVSLVEKLATQSFTLITEIKHASPIGEYSYKEIDAKSTALKFRESGSDAISVVVEPKIFRGDLANIAQAKTAGLPVLFKDFVISEKQIIAAKASGADIVLLVAKALSRTNVNLDKMIAKAHMTGLEVLLECYDENEFKVAVETDADILGINNRDLTTLKVDLGRTKRIMNSVPNSKIKQPVISESGMKTAEDVRFIVKSGVKGALVGTAIWTASDLKEKIRELKSGGVSKGERNG